MASKWQSTVPWWNDGQESLSCPHQQIGTAWSSQKKNQRTEGEVVPGAARSAGSSGGGGRIREINDA
jgi:hypothetical protein